MPITSPGVPVSLDRDAIAARIPHQGTMCLLDSVESWDNNHICCQARSHTDPANPLRAHGRLGAACGVEYAAQAMAVHGTLVGESGTSSIPAAPRAGYLASVRGVTLFVDRLDTVDGPLTVSAERVTGDDNTVLYSFMVQAGEHTLLSGRAIVVLDAAGALALPTRNTPLAA